MPGRRASGTLMKKRLHAHSSIAKLTGRYAPLHGYLEKKSTKGKWQRRWFEVTADHFCWYASARAAADGTDPLGRVPLSMVLTARAAPAGKGGFEVDLGNRRLQLALEGVPPPRQAAVVRKQRLEIHVVERVSGFLTRAEAPSRLTRAAFTPSHNAIQAAKTLF